MKILISTLSDLDVIFSLYKDASEYQQKNFPDNIWPTFERSLIEGEINEKRQFKIVINNQIACIWAVTFQDPQIWEEKDKDPSIYIHRIATNPKFRGQNFVLKIVHWAKNTQYQKIKNL